MNTIPVIDLFAGPGGLGEGFSSVLDDDGKPVFDIRLSIEKNEYAHKTLEWRSFYRQFIKSGKKLPKEYYMAYKESDLGKREVIIKKALDYYAEGKIAQNEARLLEVGSEMWPAKDVDKLIKQQLGKEPGNWVLIGGPPCQAYSLVGRSRRGEKSKGGLDPQDVRVYLYKEYLRIIKKHKPAVFVMENVKGLLSSKVGKQKVFDLMKEDLRVKGNYELHSFVRPANNDSDYLIESEKYGVPQKRHRVILLGIRKDLEHLGEYLSQTRQVRLDSIIGELPKLRSGLNREFKKHDYLNPTEIGKPKRVYKNLKDSDSLWESYLKNFLERIKEWGDLSPNGLSQRVIASGLGTGDEFVESGSTISTKHPLKKWYESVNHKGFSYKMLGGIANHESRAHLTQDLMRYLFAGLYVEEYETIPRLADFAKYNNQLIPDHENVDSGKFKDRFRVQVKDQPATTVTCHISKDGHYFIHYDPMQCRSLTVREAARIQTFPDSYLFRGNRTHQFHQVGNAVPPYLANQLGKIVSNIIANG